MLSQAHSLWMFTAYAYNSENSHLSKTSHVPRQKFTPHSRRRDRRRYDVTESSREVRRTKRLWRFSQSRSSVYYDQALRQGTSSDRGVVIVYRIRMWSTLFVL